MRNRNWLTSDSQQRQLFGALITSSLRRARQALALLAFAVIWTALAMSLIGCATRSEPPCQPLELPQPPALSEPIPQESYSLRVQRSLLKWEASLTGTPQMSKP